MCKDSCSYHGYCALGTCRCDIGWRGDICNERYVIRGRVDERGITYCEKNYRGPLCNEKICPNDCSDHGICEGGVCGC